jgi:hypothetical protein
MALTLTLKQQTKMKNDIKFILSIMSLMFGVIGALYIWLYLGFVLPIITIALAIDAGTLTAMLVATNLKTLYTPVTFVSFFIVLVLVRSWSVLYYLIPR